MQVWDDRWACLEPLFRLRRRVGRGVRMRLVCRFKRGALGFRENCALARSASSPICVLRLPIDDPHYVCASGRSRDCCGNWPKTYATGADWISEKPSSALSSVRRLRGTGVGLTKCGKGGKTQQRRVVRVPCQCLENHPAICAPPQLPSSCHSLGGTKRKSSWI